MTGSSTRIDLLKRQLVLAEAGAKFTQADLNQVTDRIENDRQALERELSEAEARISSALQALETARDEQRVAQAQPGIDRSAITRANEKIATRQAQFDTAQAAIRILRFMLESEKQFLGSQFDIGVIAGRRSFYQKLPASSQCRRRR